MYCFNCGSRLSEMGYCTACGVDVRQYKKLMFAANQYYNDGLERARVRDLSGAIASLKLCLRLNRKHMDALNLMGLIYHELGETVQALSAWVLSLNITPEKNMAKEYMDSIQTNPTRIDTINMIIKKYNKSLEYCYQGSFDLAVLQLKKVLNLSPNFVSAHKLLALVYMQRQEWEKANRELNRAQKIDNGDVDVKRYLVEVEHMLRPIEEKNSKKKKSKDNVAVAIHSKSGNETIIQPLNERESIGLQTFAMVAIGIVIGILISVFLITPAKVRTTKESMNTQIAEYGEQLDTKNAEIDSLQARITQLEASNISLQQDLGNYTGGGSSDAYNSLIAAAYSYLDPSQSNLSVEQKLNEISAEYVEANASEDFRNLYSYLMAQIGDSVAETYYESGLEAYNEKDFPLAISNLQKAYLYDSTSDAALYYLGLAYYESGDNTNATATFQDLINLFPDSTLADKARQKLEELAE